MTGLALVVLSLRVLPLQDNEPGLKVRYRVAEAIERVTHDRVERRLMMVVSALESHYSPDVIACERKGDNGAAVTAWQLHVFGANRRRVCSSLVEAARTALQMMRASFSACPGHPLSEGLATYNSGRCDRGRRISRHRWELATGVRP